MMVIKKYLDDLGWLKKTVFFLLVISFLYSLSSFFLKPTYTSEIDLEGQPSGEAELDKIMISSSRDCSRLLGSLQQKQMFAPLYREKRVAGGVNPEEIIKNLKLVGIISTKPFRAVINDLKDNKTYYLEEGGSISDIIRVDEIKKDSIVIECYGERFELYL